MKKFCFFYTALVLALASVNLQAKVDSPPSLPKYNVLYIPLPNSGIRQAFLYSNGTVTELGTLGGFNTFVNAINDAGEIVGASDTSGDEQQYAFLFSGWKIIDLGTLVGEGGFSTADGINNAGQIVGQSEIDTQFHTVIFLKSGKIIDMGALNSTDLSSATDINDAGQIIGVDTNGSALFPYLFMGRTEYNLYDLIPSNSDIVHTSNLNIENMNPNQRQMCILEKDNSGFMSLLLR